jgi:hypothetical protein
MQSLSSRNFNIGPGVVACAYNPSYMEGKGWRIAIRRQNGDKNYGLKFLKLSAQTKAGDPI